jgi:hypothetical protein
MITAVTQLVELLQATRSRSERRRTERALIALWVLAPVSDDHTALDHRICLALRQAPADDWFVAVLDNQFADARPEDYEYYAGRRTLQRFIDVVEAEGTSVNAETATPRQLVKARARRVVEVLKSRGVPEKYSAIVEVIDQSDGGKRYIGT